MAVRPSVAFRPLAAGDLPLLARWLAEPHVERFYRERSDLPSVRHRYLPAIRGEDPTDLFMIVFGDAGSPWAIGMTPAVPHRGPSRVARRVPAGGRRAWTGPSASTT